jgi:hypothetical protein
MSFLSHGMVKASHEVLRDSKEEITAIFFYKMSSTVTLQEDM